MDASSSLEQADLDKLNDKDKRELRKFISNEQQRTRIQSRKPTSISWRCSTPCCNRADNSAPPTETHALTDICWKKCVSGTIRNGKRDKSEEGCLASCVDRFLDVNLLTMKHLQSMRQG